MMKIKPLRWLVRALLRTLEAASVQVANFPRRSPRVYKLRPAWDLLKAHQIARCVRDGDSVLDVGCGSGHTLEELMMFRNIQPLGVDLALDRMAHSKVPARVYDGRKLEFEDDSFDVLLAGYVLHHLDRTSAASLLAEMTRVARRCVILLEDSLPEFGSLYRLRNYCHRVEAGLLYDSESSEYGSGAARDDSMFLTHSGWRSFLGDVPGVTHVEVESMADIHKYKHHTLIIMDVGPTAASESSPGRDCGVSEETAIVSSPRASRHRKSRDKGGRFMGNVTQTSWTGLPGAIAFLLALSGSAAEACPDRGRSCVHTTEGMAARPSPKLPPEGGTGETSNSPVATQNHWVSIGAGLAAEPESLGLQLSGSARVHNIEVGIRIWTRIVFETESTSERSDVMATARMYPLPEPSSSFWIGSYFGSSFGYGDSHPVIGAGLGLSPTRWLDLGIKYHTTRLGNGTPEKIPILFVSGRVSGRVEIPSHPVYPDAPRKDSALEKQDGYPWLRLRLGFGVAPPIGKDTVPRAGPTLGLAVLFPFDRWALEASAFQAQAWTVKVGSSRRASGTTLVSLGRIAAYRHFGMGRDRFFAGLGIAAGEAETLIQGSLPLKVSTVNDLQPQLEIVVGWVRSMGPGRRLLIEGGVILPAPYRAEIDLLSGPVVRDLFQPFLGVNTGLDY